MGTSMKRALKHPMPKAEVNKRLCPPVQAQTNQLPIRQSGQLTLGCVLTACKHSDLEQNCPEVIGGCARKSLVNDSMVPLLALNAQRGMNDLHRGLQAML